MRKAIRIRAVLWVEGEQAPAEDFAAYVTGAVERMLERGARELEGLRLTVKRVEEDRSDEDAE